MQFTLLELVEKHREKKRTSAEFTISVGVDQSSSLSPLYYFVVIDAVTGDLQRLTPWMLLYVDEFVLASERRDDFER